MRPALLLCALAILQAGPPPSPPALTDEAAYDVYNVIIPREWTVRATTARSLVILDSTARPPKGCFPSGEPVEGAWKEVAEDFTRTNASSWSLTSRLALGRPHVSARREEVEALFASKSTGSGWYDFNTRHPESLGFIEVSAVGFNRPHTKAMVYVSHSCGEVCGGGAFNFLEKTDEGTWREIKLKGNTCSWTA